MARLTRGTRYAGGRRRPARFAFRARAVAFGPPLNKSTGRRSVWRLLHTIVFVTLAGYLLFAHGCHGDEDTELFAWLTRVVGL